MWGNQTELAFIWSHMTKELPVMGPGPPTAILDGRWSVGECSVSGGEVDCTGGLPQKMDRISRKREKKYIMFFF